MFGLFLNDQVGQARERLAGRYPHPADAWGQAGSEAELSACIASGDNQPAWQHPALYLREDAPGPLTAEDVLDALVLSGYATRTRLRDERQLIDMARRRGVPWPHIARALGFGHARHAQRHHRWLAGMVGAGSFFLTSEAAGEVD
jgi:hypothetical protein